MPGDLLVALVCWHRAHHHGSAEEERDAAEQLAVALDDHIAAIRAMAYPAMYGGGFKAGMLRAAELAQQIEPSSVSATGEAHMRSYREAIVHSIRRAVDE